MKRKRCDVSLIFSLSYLIHVYQTRRKIEWEKTWIQYKIMFVSGQIVVNSEKTHVSLRIKLAHLDDRKEKIGYSSKIIGYSSKYMLSQTKYALIEVGQSYKSTNDVIHQAINDHPTVYYNDVITIRTFLYFNQIQNRIFIFDLCF